MGIIVQKFGGSSVADATKIKNVAKRIARTHEGGHAIVVAVSAMGDTTDNLVRLAHEISIDPPERELDMLLSTGETGLNCPVGDGGFRTWIPSNLPHRNAGGHHHQRLL